jgi:putative spermidine/putrescine transport system ATP-binding protein
MVGQLSDDSIGGHVSGDLPTANGGVSVAVRELRHVYDNGFEAIKPMTLEVEGGSFCTLLGPSGSGKTTLLRVLAGLLQPTEGRVFIGGRDITRLPVQQRDVGFVFQHYALFPHMTAYQNIEYPLKIRRWSRDARRRRVAEILELIDLAAFAKSRPDELSGGQQQRVAVGRALVYHPKVLLLDEPLGALDRKLRQQLGTDLRWIQKQAGTTAIYVTHDQEEAFILSDHVVVMDHGNVLQEGRPDQVYGRPSSLFVAGFLGETNFVRGTVVDVGSSTARLQTSTSTITCVTPLAGVEVGEAYACSVRPEDVVLGPASAQVSDDHVALGTGKVHSVTFMGSRYRIVVEMGDRDVVVESYRGDTIPEEGETVLVTWPVGAGILVADDESVGSRRRPDADHPLR